MINVPVITTVIRPCLPLIPQQQRMQDGLEVLHLISFLTDSKSGEQVMRSTEVAEPTFSQPLLKHPSKPQMRGKINGNDT